MKDDDILGKKTSAHLYAKGIERILRYGIIIEDEITVTVKNKDQD